MVLLWVDYWAVHLKKIPKQKQVNNMKPNTVIDVRSPEEYMGGHVAGSINTEGTFNIVQFRLWPY
jgi:rhodanese-related sulfurtransferase